MSLPKTIHINLRFGISVQSLTWGYSQNPICEMYLFLMRTEGTHRKKGVLFLPNTLLQDGLQSVMNMPKIQHDKIGFQTVPCLMIYDFKTEHLKCRSYPALIPRTLQLQIIVRYARWLSACCMVPIASFAVCLFLTLSNQNLSTELNRREIWNQKRTRSVQHVSESC